MEFIFWFCFTIIFYTYFGYGLLLFFLVTIKRLFAQKKLYDDNYLPEVTIMVAAYNEADFIEKKISNTFELNYPKDKIRYLFVTDGSDDETPNLVKIHSEIHLLHQPKREGKIKAVQRAMGYVSTPVVIFTDANTLLNKDAVKKIVRHYQDKQVGAVAGEKRISVGERDKASGAGEGIYWKYESTLKKWDSELYSVVGAAGELFSIRTHLYEPIPEDTIIEDFYLSMKIAQKGYLVKYEPDSYAIEKPSFSVEEELKRKIRISAGGLQAIVRLLALLNVFKYGTLSFQYISHRVLRWTITPFCLVALVFINFFLAFESDFYLIFLFIQMLFYTLAILGALFASRKIKLKIFFIPYYFLVMNYSVFAGINKYLNRKQSVIWEKAKRA